MVKANGGLEVSAAGGTRSLLEGLWCSPVTGICCYLSLFLFNMSQPNAIAINITLDSQNYQERIVSMNTAFRGFGRASHITNDQMIRPQIRQIVLMLQKSSRGLTKYC